MKQEAKISVIVPVYGVERYISDCIRSLCDQTWKNLEILLIDDGSKDGSGKICDEWAKKDSRIRVFHVENGGQSRARNIGMKEASGDYIGFVDGDDAAAPKMYEHLYGLMQKYDAQIAECNFEGRKSPEPDQMQEQAVVTMSGKGKKVGVIKLRLFLRCLEKLRYGNNWIIIRTAVFPRPLCGQNYLRHR